MQLKFLLNVSYFAILCFFFTLPAMAQNKVVSGKVTDAKDGSPLTGVSVLAKGTNFGITTNTNGTFKLSVPESTTILVVSYIGYTAQEITAASGVPVSIKLESSSSNLNEVVVVSVGYGTQRKKDLTGAVANVSSKDFNQGSIVDPLDQIKGKVAGVVITTGGGDPNQASSIRLRGQTSVSGDQSPLFVVDGVPLDNAQEFQNIAPGDIESYDILKDASATSIYGSRGANGVIIVTTKKGKAGRTTVDYNGYVSTGTQSKYYDLLTTPEYLATPEAKANPQTGQGESDNVNTNWQKAINRTAFTNSNNLAISGGSDGFNYRASLNYQNEQGVIINSGKQQLGVRFNGEEKALNNKLDITLGISNVNTNRSLVNYSDIGYVFNALPTIPVRLANGSFNDFGAGYQAYNPVEYLTDTYDRHNEYLTNINSTINYTIVPGLVLGATGATSRNNVQTHLFIPSFTTQQNLSQASDTTTNTNSYKGDIHLNYDTHFGKNSLSATLVDEYNVFYTDYFFASAQGLLNPLSLDNNLGTGSSPVAVPIGSYKDKYEIQSYLARINYNYDSRFYATASIRSDMSSKFSSGHQTGYFPAFDLAYRLKRDLLSNVDWINDLKIRAGLGETGNANGVGPYTNLALVGPPTGTNNTQYYSGASGGYLPFVTPLQNPNPDLSWEKRIGRNVGLDFSLFNDRLSGNMNYYNDKTTDLLFAVSVPQPPNIYPTTEANIGSLTNKGFELQLTGQILTGDGLKWTASGNINFLKTRIQSLSGTLDGTAINTPFINVGLAQGQGLSSNPITRFVPGYAPYVFYLPHYTGVNAQGVEEFDGKTVAQWAAETGGVPPSHYIDPSPKFNYGINNSFSYKNWNLSFFLRGVYGQKIFNNTLLDYETVTRLPGTNTTQAALTNGVTSGPVASDRWLEGASYLKLDNASLGYTFSHIKGFNTLRIYVATNNLFTITKYRGLDPEVNVASSTSPNQNYIDADYGGYAYYPPVRSFTFGTNVSFK
ncbi:SusC/RagA family TonB-linked outer membrane protein [Mucilaginibacter sp. L196]|uniref:SusC/RagA family TonB-linked outer membrane protein n=1 Tax=Mucilaginibacter sp. L196 TaxID=1641870 RepID=UPI00131C3338|nr:SusC/RagA family TonB-linked outer membrane protein [Mucilaginibacter sp. L196]